MSEGSASGEVMMMERSVKDVSLKQCGTREHDVSLASLKTQKTLNFIKVSDQTDLTTVC